MANGDSDEVPFTDSDRPTPADDWWSPPWEVGTPQDPDAGWSPVTEHQAQDSDPWDVSEPAEPLSDDAIMKPLEAQFGQIRSRDRVTDLAEVFTHQREVDAMLDQIPDAFTSIDVKFLEPSCGSGNFLVEILRRKLRLVAKADCVCQEQYEHRLLRAVASIYGIDISPENVTEAHARMAHVLLGHYQSDANTNSPTSGFLNAAALILGANIVVGDTLNNADDIELCDWQPRPHGCFQRVWSAALVPEAERHLFWMERVEDAEPVHYSVMAQPAPVKQRRKGADK